MDRWQYLIVLGACLAATAPLEAVGARVYRRPRLTARAVLPTAAAFVLWDLIAVTAGVWSYDPRFVTGLRILPRLPLEEVLFFLVIPLCALLTYGCVETLARRTAEAARKNREAA